MRKQRLGIPAGIDEKVLLYVSAYTHCDTAAFRSAPAASGDNEMTLSSTKKKCFLKKSVGTAPAAGSRFQ